MIKIHIVFGSTGEYSDHHTWMVRAFLDKRTATSFAKKCQGIVDTENFDYWQFKHSKWKHPLDKNFHLDYTGTSYSVSSIPLEECSRVLLMIGAR